MNGTIETSKAKRRIDETEEKNKSILNPACVVLEMMPHLEV